LAQGHLCVLQGVRWDRGSTELADECAVFYEKKNENSDLGTGLFVHKIVISAVKRVEFASDRMLHILMVV
jgi:hypothetical protein